MSEIPALFAQRPIVIKHYKAAMYHPFIEAAGMYLLFLLKPATTHWRKKTALTLVDVPITTVTLLLFGVILYFLVGLQRSAGQFLYALHSQIRQFL